MLSSKKEQACFFHIIQEWGGSDSIGVSCGFLTGFSVIICGILTKNYCTLFLLHWIFWIACYHNNVSLFLLASKPWKESLRFVFFHERIYFGTSLWKLTLNLEFLSENFYQVAKGNTASLLDSVMARKLYFPRAGISDLTVPASTERPSPYLLECFAQFFSISQRS